tara:strand:- start:797 stop:1555 length:759 start_codon:yes stop_codon:yes gene_type:complete
MKALSCENITVRFGGVLACQNISLGIEKGQVSGLIGANGAGKTTLFNVLTRFQDHESGHIFFNGENIDSKKPHDMASLGLVRTFQNINLFKDQTTLNNILIGAHHRLGNPLASMFSLPSARRNEKQLNKRAHEIAEILHLEDYLDHVAANLPYGHQKRVELARALASDPKVVLLDEPVAGCNDEETNDLKESIKRLNRDLGITFFLVEHDMSMVMDSCDYIYAINFGENLAQGTPTEIQNNPDVIKAYLGED